LPQLSQLLAPLTSSSPFPVLCREITQRNLKRLASACNATPRLAPSLLPFSMPPTSVQYAGSQRCISLDTFISMARVFCLMPPLPPSYMRAHPKSSSIRCPANSVAIAQDAATLQHVTSRHCSASSSTFAQVAEDVSEVKGITAGKGALVMAEVMHDTCAHNAEVERQLYRKTWRLRCRVRLRKLRRLRKSRQVMIMLRRSRRSRSR
jgi:hypothetical protein